MSPTERIDTATAIPHTPEQAARANAGERIHGSNPANWRELSAPVAARRLIGFLLTTKRATIKFDRDAQAIVVVSADQDPQVFDAGDILIDYNECIAIKELLDQVEDGQ
jgi:hypothetical protein